MKQMLLEIAFNESKMKAGAHSDLLYEVWSTILLH